MQNMLTTRPVRSIVFLPLGVASAIIGLLPWIITGMRSPLQNLWATPSSPAEMPIVLLPVSQYSAVVVVALLLVGSAIGGIVGRAVSAQHPGSAWAALIGGVLLVQVIAIAQTTIVLSRGLLPGRPSAIYLGALVGGAVVATLLGVGVLTLIARAPKAGALIALSISAIALGSWASGLFFPITGITTASPLTTTLGQVARYLPAVAIGAAIAWCGIGTVGRVIAAIIGLVLLWVGPAVVTAVSAAIGSRVLAHYPSQMLDFGVSVFRSALTMPELWVTTLALAGAVAAIGLVGRRVVVRRAGVRGENPVVG
jgi:hypothetical protein